jgi:O-antigen/teichoic acid export membrane protein
MSIDIKKESKLLAKHSIVYGFGNMLNNLAAFLLLPIYTRYLTPTDYGVKELVALSTQVVSILLATAISSAMYRFYFDYEDEKNRNEVLSSSIITIGGAGLIVIFFLSFFTKPLAKVILNSSDLYIYFIISFSGLWFQILNDIGYNYLKLKQKSLTFVMFSFGKLVLAILLNIYLIIYLKMGVMGVFISTLVSSVVVALILIVPILVKTGLRFSTEKIKDMLKFGLPLIPSQLGAFIVHLSDRFFLKAYTSIAETGIYSLGYRFGAIPNNFISGPFNQIWQPRRFELYKQEDSEYVFGKIFTYFLFAMFFVGLGISILTKDVLMIMSDPQFWSAYKIVPVIVLATTIFSFHYHFNMGILISKKTKYLFYINFSNGIIVLFLNFLLIKPFGIWGAAYATLLAFIYKVSLTYYFSSKYYKVYFEFARLGKLIVVAAFIYGISLLFNFNNIYLNFIIKTLLIFTYPVFLFLIGFFTRDELSNVRDFIKSRLVTLKAAYFGS